MTLYFTDVSDEDPIGLDFRDLGEVPGYGYVYAIMHVSGFRTSFIYY